MNLVFELCRRNSYFRSDLRLIVILVCLTTTSPSAQINTTITIKTATLYACIIVERGNIYNITTQTFNNLTFSVLFPVMGVDSLTCYSCLGAPGSDCYNHNTGGMGSTTQDPLNNDVCLSCVTAYGPSREYSNQRSH